LKAQNRRRAAVRKKETRRKRKTHHGSNTKRRWVKEKGGQKTPHGLGKRGAVLCRLPREKTDRPGGGKAQEGNLLSRGRKGTKNVNEGEAQTGI